VPNLVEAIVVPKSKEAGGATPGEKRSSTCCRTFANPSSYSSAGWSAAKSPTSTRRLAAVVRLASAIPKERICAIEEIHTASGKHRVVRTPFPKWVPSEVLRAGKKLPLDEASGCCAASCRLVERLELDDRRAVVRADPEGHGRGRVVDVDAPDVGAARQEIGHRFAGAVCSRASPGR